MTDIAILNDAAALANFDNALDQLDQHRVDLQYLKFSKGEFTYGKEGIYIEDDEEFVFNPTSWAKGYICWKDRKPEKRLEYAYTGKVVCEADLPEMPGSDGWTAAESVEFQSVETGETLEFTSSTIGGINAIKALLNAFSDYRKRKGRVALPVISMQAGNYESKHGNTVYYPVFNIVRFVESIDDCKNDDIDDAEVIVETVPAHEPAMAPVRRKRPDKVN